MTVERLDPHQLIELTDVCTGLRKMGITDATGSGYFDVVGDGAMPKPLHPELAPTVLGTFNEWLEPLPEAAAQAFLSAWELLTNRRLDVLTMARALRWGLQHNNFDATVLEKAGLEATGRVHAALAQQQHTLTAQS